MSDDPSRFPGAGPHMQQPEATAIQKASPLDNSLRAAVRRLAQARPFAKPGIAPSVLELVHRLLMQEDGIERLYQLAPLIADAGIFTESDWERPQNRVAGLVRNTLERGDRHTVTLECLSLLHILAVSNGACATPGYSSEQARHFLTQVLALNLHLVFAGGASEVARLDRHGMGTVLDRLFAYLAAHIGYEDILGNLCEEIWRLLGQRPIQVHHVKAMITQIALTLTHKESGIGDVRLGADRLISALFGPTQGCVDDPGLPAYRERLSAMDFPALQKEALGFSRAMHDVGLVSDYHADFMRWLLEQDHHALIVEALGLSATGRDSLQCYSQLVYKLIDEAVHTETAQAVYGLAQMLERGVLYIPSIAPGLWRQIGLKISAPASAIIAGVFGTARSPHTYLLAGVIEVLGQPLGVGQGNNPTCQSARAICMWSFIEPDYLLQLVAQVARFDNILMHFEGTAINSADLTAGLVAAVPVDNDPVSTLLVPHLDRIYLEMGRHCADRGEDPHCWINPEFHGWWVGRQFAIAVDVASGNLKEYDRFLRHFFASYHPLYNGNQLMIHAQPAGLAMTDSAARFVGWHAIALLRVALDQDGTMRVYFYNPNNDSGQDLGNDVVVSTQGHGERFGESSLPFNQLASRIYIFHDEPLSTPPLEAVPEAEIADARSAALTSWARDRVAPEAADAS